MHQEESPMSRSGAGFYKTFQGNSLEASSYLESGYGSYNSTRPFSKHSSFGGVSCSSGCRSSAQLANLTNEPPTPTTATLNNLIALRLNTPQSSSTSPLKRRVDTSNPQQYTPKKQRLRFASENEENELNTINTPTKQENTQSSENAVKRRPILMAKRSVSFRDRLMSDPSIISSPVSPIHGTVSSQKTGENLNNTFESIASSTPIANPFRAEFYTQKEVDVLAPGQTHSATKAKRTKMLRKMQSFSPKTAATAYNKRAWDLKNVHNVSAFDEMDEQFDQGHDPPKCGVTELDRLIHGEIKMNSPEEKGMSAGLIDVYVNNLSSLNGTSVMEGGVITPQKQTLEVHSAVMEYFDELKRNAGEAQRRETALGGPLLKHVDSLDLIHKPGKKESKVESTEKSQRITRKRSSDNRSPSILSTPKKMRRSLSMQMASELEKHKILHSTEEVENTPPKSLTKKARKRLNYGGVPSPAKKRLNFAMQKKRSTAPCQPSLIGTSQVNVFKLFAPYSPILESFIGYLDGKDLSRLCLVSKLCKDLVESNPKWNDLRLQYLRQTNLKKENLHAEELVKATTSDLQNRFPLHDNNILTQVEMQHFSPVSPSKRRFHENQKLIHDNPDAFLTPCPRCRWSSIILQDLVEDKRRMSVPVIQKYHSMARKQVSLPETRSASLSKGSRVAICQNLSCGIRFCTECKYEYQSGHKCVQIEPMSPLRAERARRRQTFACSKQSKKNLKRL